MSYKAIKLFEKWPLHFGHVLFKTRWKSLIKEMECTSPLPEIKSKITSAAFEVLNKLPSVKQSLQTRSWNTPPKARGNINNVESVIYKFAFWNFLICLTKYSQELWTEITYCRVSSTTASEEKRYSERGKIMPRDKPWRVKCLDFSVWKELFKVCSSERSQKCQMSNF